MVCLKVSLVEPLFGNIWWSTGHIPNEEFRYNVDVTYIKDSIFKAFAYNEAIHNDMSESTRSLMKIISYWHDDT